MIYRDSLWNLRTPSPLHVEPQCHATFSLMAHRRPDRRLPDRTFVYKGADPKGNPLKPIPYREIDLNKSWESYDLDHALTRKGIERFVADFESTLRNSASAA